MTYDTGAQGKYLQIGVVGRARGLKGHVNVRPFTDDPGFFLGLSEVWVEADGSFRAVPIAEAAAQAGSVTLRLGGVEDRTAAEAYNGRALYILREQAGELPKDSYFIADLIGCSVVDDGGAFLGNLSEVTQAGAADVYVLRGGPGGEILFPALKSVIVSTDIAARRIIVNARRFQEVAVCED